MACISDSINILGCTFECTEGTCIRSTSKGGNPRMIVRIDGCRLDTNYPKQPLVKGEGQAHLMMQGNRINIFVADLKNMNSTQLTGGAGNNESPSWSPDGSLIAFSSTRQGPSRIFVMTAYGTDQRRLLAVAGEQTNPAWSPNIIND